MRTRSPVRLTLMPLLAGLLLQPAPVRAAYVDVLDRPALASALAVKAPLVDIAMAGHRLVTVGQRGHILLSDDGGSRWRQARVPVSSDLNAVDFPTPSEGWAVGHDGVILHSGDGGETWERQLDGRRIGALMLAAQQARALENPGDPALPRLRQEAERFIAEGADKPFLDVHFDDARHGIAAGAFNLLLRTDDGGRHWQPVADRADNPQGFHLYGIAAAGGERYLTGEQGLLLRLDRVRDRYAALPAPYAGTLFGACGDDSTLIVHGLRGHVFRSRDGGSHWQPVPVDIQASITGCTAAGDGRYYLFGQGGQVLESHDHGLSFRQLPQPAAQPVSAGILSAPDRLTLVGVRGVRTLAVSPATHP